MTHIWRKDYNSFYKIFLDKKQTVYNLGMCSKFIKERIINNNFINNYETLIDVACGDGIWSIVLSDFFHVTGVDNSYQAIINANILKNKYSKNINFICDDIKNINGKYDIVFCRGPEFIGGYSPDDNIFKNFIPKLIELCKKKLYIIVYSKEPFNYYANEKKTSYYHSPKVLTDIFSIYGKTYTTFKDNYIVLELDINV